MNTTSKSVWNMHETIYPDHGLIFNETVQMFGWYVSIHANEFLGPAKDYELSLTAAIILGILVKFEMQFISSSSFCILLFLFLVLEYIRLKVSSSSTSVNFARSKEAVLIFISDIFGRQCFIKNELPCRCSSVQCSRDLCKRSSSRRLPEIFSSLWGSR